MDKEDKRLTAEDLEKVIGGENVDWQYEDFEGTRNCPFCHQDITKEKWADHLAMHEKNRDRVQV